MLQHVQLSKRLTQTICGDLRSCIRGGWPRCILVDKQHAPKQGRTAEYCIPGATSLQWDSVAMSRSWFHSSKMWTCQQATHLIPGVGDELQQAGGRGLSLAQLLNVFPEELGSVARRLCTRTLSSVATSARLTGLRVAARECCNFDDTRYVPLFSRKEYIECPVKL